MLQQLGGNGWTAEGAMRAVPQQEALYKGVSLVD